MRHSTDPLTALQALLERCRVRVSGRTDGSGFFVAPGYVLSCAHVAGGTAGARVRVEHGEVAYGATVLAAAPDESLVDRSPCALYPYPDLALLEVEDPPVGHPCVWLDPESPSSGTKLTAAGFTLELGPRTALLDTGGWTGPFGRALLELVAGEVNRGLSGGPVLSHRSGGVAAVVKATRQEDSAMGGYGVPVSALRLLDPAAYRRVLGAHDRFHAADDRWRSLADALAEEQRAGAGAERSADRAFLALLAELPAGPSAELRAAFLRAAPPGTPEPDLPLLDRRDAYLELAARITLGGDRLTPELAYCADLVRSLPPHLPVARGLRDRLLIRAGETGRGEAARERIADDPHAATLNGSATGTAAGASAAGGASRPSVIGRVRHSLRDRGRYHVMVWQFRSAAEIVPAGAESGELTLPQALSLLAELLPSQIEVVEALDGSDRAVLVELVLPHEALDEDYADWRLWPGLDWWTLGRKHQLVVRPLERHQEPRLHHAWRRRWERLDVQALDRALVCVCGRGRQHPRALDAAFNTDPELTALALAGAPRGEVLSRAFRVAVASGVPVMLWERDRDPRPLDREVCATGCAAPGRGDCPDDRFLRAARKALTGTHRDALPDRVYDLRNEAELDEPAPAPAQGPAQDPGTDTDTAPGAAPEHAPAPDGRDAPLGHRVVLLWDDPARQLPRTRLAPATVADPTTATARPADAAGPPSVPSPRPQEGLPR
ncbi:trypsin-like peptidase domain-containing protein [Kitasatospora sp. NPDC001540]|uniref:VMAP-C domain-containing protein n=1 Tax=Kitasatospora sp. NPDC001540 TaxID=3364014 RepID=UPI0036CF2A56